MKCTKFSNIYLSALCGWQLLEKNYNVINVDVKCTRFSNSCFKCLVWMAVARKNYKVRNVDVKCTKFCNICLSALCEWQLLERNYKVRNVDVKCTKLSNIGFSDWCGWQFIKAIKRKMYGYEMIKFFKPLYKWLVWNAFDHTLHWCYYFYIGSLFNYDWPLASKIVFKT